jgi:Sec-independent protein translocase protein TatA
MLSFAELLVIFVAIFFLFGQSSYAKEVVRKFLDFVRKEIGSGSESRIGTADSEKEAKKEGFEKSKEKENQKEQK